MKLRIWINLYRAKSDGKFDLGDTYVSREEADKYALNGRVACVECVGEVDLPKDMQPEVNL